MPETVTLLKRADIDPSPFNPRIDGLTAAALKDLTDSIKEKGVLQPVIVRPHPTDQGRYEMVAGHRRLAGAGFAKLDKLPALIRDYTEREAREIQLIENLQREGIREIEEAGGYQELLDLPAASGVVPHTVESIARKVGKSPAYVYGRLKLLKLPELALTALQGAVISPSVALLIARIPDPKLALKATREILCLDGVSGEEAQLITELAKRIKGPDDEYQWWSTMSFRKAKAHVADHYTKRLKGAPFNPEDPVLVPAAGPCSKCPHRSGNLQDVDPKEIGGTDVCTSPGCFKQKAEATKRAEAARLKEKGLTPLPPAAAAQALANADGAEIRMGGYIDLRAKPNGKRKTFEEILNVPAEVPQYVAPNPDDPKKKHYLVKVEDVAPQLKEAGLKIKPPAPEPISHADQQQQQAEARALANQFLSTLVVPRVQAAVAKATPRELLAWLVVEDDVMDAKRAKDADVKAMVAALFLRKFHGQANWQGRVESGDQELCEFLGIDLKPLEKQFLADLKAGEAKPAAKKK